MKHILVLTEIYPDKQNPSLGIFVQYLLRELSQYYKITVFHPHPYFLLKSSPIQEDEILTKTKYEKNKFGIETIRPKIPYLPIGDRIWIRAIAFSILSIIYLFKNRNKYDLLFGQMACPGGFAAVVLKKIFKIPSLITARGSDVNVYPKVPILRYFTRYAFKNSDNIVTVAKDLSLTLRNSYNLHKIPTTIYNGTNHNIFYSSNKTRNINTILFVGHFIKRKAVEELINAFSKISINAKLIMVGSGELKPQIIKLINELNLSGKVHLVGRKQPEEIAKYMNAASILCLPSYSEGTPNVVLEAISCGLPVVATNVNGIPEIITNDKLGILIEPGNVLQLTEALKEALLKKWDNRYISNYGQQFSWEKTGLEYKEIIERMLNVKN